MYKSQRVSSADLVSFLVYEIEDILSSFLKFSGHKTSIKRIYFGELLMISEN